MLKKFAITGLAVATLAAASVSATTTPAEAGGSKGLALGIIAGATALGVGAAIAHGHGPTYGHPTYGYCEVRKVRVWHPYKGRYVWRPRKVCY